MEYKICRETETMKIWSEVDSPSKVVLLSENHHKWIGNLKAISKKDAGTSISQRDKDSDETRLNSDEPELTSSETKLLQRSNKYGSDTM